MNQNVWWRGLPYWLKLVFLLMALPAWLFITFCVLTGQNKSIAAYAAFAVFSLAALLNLVFDHRRDRADDAAGDIDFGESDS